MFTKCARLGLRSASHGGYPADGRCRLRHPSRLLAYHRRKSGQHCTAPQTGLSTRRNHHASRNQIRPLAGRDLLGESCLILNRIAAMFLSQTLFWIRFLLTTFPMGMPQQHYLVSKRFPASFVAVPKPKQRLRASHWSNGSLPVWDCKRHFFTRKAIPLPPVPSFGRSRTGRRHPRRLQNSSEHFGVRLRHSHAHASNGRRSSSRQSPLSCCRDTQAFSGYQDIVSIRCHVGRRRCAPHGIIRICSRVRSTPRLHSGL